jgi:hypothetical protein
LHQQSGEQAQWIAPVRSKKCPRMAKSRNQRTAPRNTFRTTSG